jgi:hypothetical protein
MSLAFIHGKMVENMKDFTRMIRNMVTECTLGVMLKSTLDGGTVENSMALVFLLQRTVKKSMVFGKMAKSCNGSQMRK